MSSRNLGVTEIECVIRQFKQCVAKILEREHEENWIDSIDDLVFKNIFIEEYKHILKADLAPLRNKAIE